MPTPPLSDAECIAAHEAMQRHRTQGEAAAELGIARESLQRRLRQHEARGLGRSPSPAELAEAYKPAAPDISPREMPKYRVIAPASDKLLRVLVIGDAHDHPGIPDKSRFRLIGKLAAAERHDVILSIGDFLDLHSLCTHTREDTYKGKAKPSFAQDIDSAALAMAALEAELPADYKPRKHITFGNHEGRAWRYEDANPATIGQMTGQVENVFESHGWSHQAFGHWTMIGGVGFTHVPRNIMGRPVGGKNVENTVANEATWDIVFGHSHRHNVVHRAKHGYNNSVTVVNAGTAMPPGYVADYAEGLPTGYHYGVVELVIFDGRIQSAVFRSFRELGIRFLAQALGRTLVA
ncbi:metallophosphoesterase [Azospirillum sp.]|uniref:metallophosphoesterase n=1 Tax=Azospirillum sp. TaxID=34012 RepID=UPI003D713148